MHEMSSQASTERRIKTASPDAMTHRHRQDRHETGPSAERKDG